ncbi:MAG: sensor domain-containing diguanylate cyclase [Alphaproteobacteria bacterium]|nr:sensor domain-containing diguanylate cyclase [Alphaproteobacteria bacterium]
MPHNKCGSALLNEGGLLDLVMAAPIGICITNSAGLYEFVNPAYCEFYGYTQHELLGQEFTVVVPPEHRDSLRKLHSEFIETGAETLVSSQGDPRAEWQVVDRAGKVHTILANAVRIYNDAGDSFKVTYITDISSRKALEQDLRAANDRLKTLSMYDELTGMLNRRVGFERLENKIKECDRHKTPLSVAMIDCDHFKKINDKYGHGLGDDVLCEITNILMDSLRDTDIAFRYGGEEFVAVLPDDNSDQAGKVMQRFCDRLAMSKISSERLVVTVSVGIAQYSGEEVDALIERADSCLYDAKQQGRNRIVIAKS